MLHGKDELDKRGMEQTQLAEATTIQKLALMPFSIIACTTYLNWYGNFGGILLDSWSDSKYMRAFLWFITYLIIFGLGMVMLPYLLFKAWSKICQ